MIPVQKDISGTFHEELRSFFALSVLNIVFAALTMALGISTVTTQAARMIAEGAYVLSSPGLLLGVIAAVVGFMWLPESARMLGDVTSLQDEARTAEGNGDEAGLRLMIGMIALYRNQRSTVQRMILVSKAGGAVFLVLGLFNLAIVLMAFAARPPLAGASDPVMLAVGVAGAAINIAIGVAALYTSILIGRYSSAWEARLEDSERAGSVLDRTLERD